MPQMTIVSAMNPSRYENSYTEIMLTVWFEEFSYPLPFMASPFDVERHGKELWIRAMAGEFGPITVLPETASSALVPLPEHVERAIAVAANPFMHLQIDHGSGADGVS